MDRTTAAIITALKNEQQTLLEALGEYPKKDAFEHGVAVGNYHGVKHCLGVIESVLNDDEVRDGQL